jgi:hypothetical protein
MVAENEKGNPARQAGQVGFAACQFQKEELLAMKGQKTKGGAWQRPLQEKSGV